MIIRRVAVTAGMALAVMGVAAGVAQASPVSAPAGPPPVAAVAPAPIPLPLTEVASRGENDDAFAQFGTQVGVAVTVGSLAGTMAGAGIGCVTGLAGGPAGCLAGAVTGAGIGAVAGTIVAGGPTLAYSAWQLYETYNAAPGTSVYAQK